MPADSGVPVNAAPLRGIDGFLDGMESWALEHRGPDDGTRRAGARLFLEWNFEERQANLADLTTDDLDEFFERWLPASDDTRSAEPGAVRDAVRVLIECLTVTDGLNGGSAQAATLIAHVSASSTSDKKEEEDASAAAASDGLDRSLLDRVFFGGDALPRPLNRSTRSQPRSPRSIGDLPAFVEPTAAEVQASVAHCDVLRMVDGLSEYLRENQVPLTSASYIKLAKAKELVALLETGDTQQNVRSSREYPWLQFVDDLSWWTGAVTRLNTRLAFNPEWPQVPVTERATRLVNKTIEKGVLRSLGDNSYLIVIPEVDQDIVHWFINGLAEGDTLSFDRVASEVQDVCTLRHRSTGTRMQDVFEELSVAAAGVACEIFERFGLLHWEGSELTPSTLRNPDYPTGGSIVLTPFGRTIFADLAEGAGYRFRRVAASGD